MRLWISLCFLALVCPRIGLAQSSKELVENLPTGSINWTTAIVASKGACLADPFAQDAAPQDPSLRARRQATENALSVLKQVRMDATRCVADMMALNPEVGAKVNQVAETAQVVQENHLPDGTLEISVQIQLLGGFAQFMLPEEIKQVKTIKAMRPVGRDMMTSGDAFTGLIVDARGTGAKPAMVPLVVDENGKPVYGSAFVSREYAVQFGMCEYARTLDGPNSIARVAPNPITVKGLHTLAERKCDIVISNTDATRLRDASANLAFLKMCRVIIILD